MYNTCPTCTRKTPCICNKTQKIGPPQAPKSESLESIVESLTMRVEILEKFINELNSQSFNVRVDHLKFK